MPLRALAILALPAIAAVGRAEADFAELARRSPFGGASMSGAPIAENSADAEAFEYHGFYEEGGGRHHSIRHLPSGAAAWLAAGEELNGLRVLASDAENGSVKVQINGRERLLHLPRSRMRAIAPEEYGAPQIVSLLPGAPESAAVARIRHARAMSATPSHASAPPPAIAPSSTRPVAASTSSDTEPRSHNAPAEDAEADATKQDPRPAFKMGRGFNRVNSRIYASDHIAEHGAPPPAPAP